MTICNGGVPEGTSNCTVEISPEGRALVDGTSDERLRRLVDGTHQAWGLVAGESACCSAAFARQQRADGAVEEGGQEEEEVATSSCRCYLLRDLRGVTVLIHGRRPSLHVRRVQDTAGYTRSNPRRGRCTSPTAVRRLCPCAGRTSSECMT